MYAKILNGVVEHYPYYLIDLRRDYPNALFPDVLTDRDLADFNTVVVAEVEQPPFNHTKILMRAAELIDGAWTEVWIEQDAPPELVAERLAEQWNTIRTDRNSRLAASDWTQLPDTPLDSAKKAEWATYRQALRDVTTQVDPFAITWPTVP